MGKFAKKNQKELRQESKKRSRNPRNQNNGKSVVEEREDVVDPDSADFMHDEADQYSHKKQKDLMDRGFHSEDDEESDREQEILPVGDDDSEDEDSDDDSIDEDDRGSDEEGIPSRSAWGTKRSTYYNTGYVVKDHGRFHGSDAEEAEEEEREARELQAKFAAELEYDDFGILQTIASEEVAGQPVASAPEITICDLSKLSEFEKMERIKQQSPELLDLIADCKKKELCTVLHPLFTKLSSTEAKFLTERAELYLRTKYQLVLGYCQNITFYMSLKAKQVPVENHPVTRRLVDFRKLLLKLDPLDKLYRDDLKRAVDAITAGTDLQQFCSKPDKPHIKKSVKFAADAIATKNNKPKEQLLSKLVLEKPEKIAKLKKKSEDLEESDEEMEDDGQDVEERKRAVTYQIAKNKGTTPYRRKEYRNPRVKHRIKYRKALIRRKGQVQQHRPELKKYSGEVSGIRAGVVKSVKFK